MREFFRGWKRKVGCAILVLACAFTVGWIRSLRTEDHLTWANDKKTISLHSGSGSLKVVQRLYIGAGPPTLFWERTSWHSYEVSTPDPAPADGLIFQPIDLFNEKQSQFLGFVNAAGNMPFITGRGGNDEIRTRSFACPYIYIITPVTLLSTWLLLSKRRVRRSVE